MKFAVWHENENVREQIITICHAAGFDDSICGYQGYELLELAKRENGLGLIICGFRLGDVNAVDILLEISKVRLLPAIMVSDSVSISEVEELSRDHVMAYINEPIREVDLKSNIHIVLHRFRQFQELEHEVVALKEALESRKLIERAKAFIMRRDGVDEGCAYQQLRKLAMDQRVKMVVAAERVLQYEALLNQ